MIKKLRRKFIVINMLIISVILLISLGILCYSTGRDLKKKSINMMENIIINPFKLKVIEEHSDEVRLPYFAVLLDSQNEVDDIIGGYYDLSDVAFLEEVVQGIVNSGEGIGELENMNLRYLYKETPKYSRIVFSDTSSEKSALRNLLNTCLGTYILSFAAFLGISVLLAKWAVRPVETAWEQQKQFIADASHELKTPLTVITTNAELLENSGTNERDVRIFSGNILNMAEQMRVLLERMIELAKGDMETGIKYSKVNLSKLIMDGILPYEAVFFENDLNLEYKIEEQITVNGDPVQLRQILDILLDNALKYSDVPGKTDVLLKKQNKKFCILTVSNTGERLTDEQLKLVFQRFYRTDCAHTKKGSFGLGLAIAQNIAVNHRGKIWAESDEGINSFCVRLPMA